jgi:small subunit ribosomal protein S15
MFTTLRSLIHPGNGLVLSTRGLKSDLHIKWVRPEKIACWDPKKSGDLSPLEQLDMTKPPLEFQDSEELKT